MAAFQEIREKTEQKVMVQLLSEIERNPSFTQRNLAGELGIALGLMNSYLKSSVRKGWVRVSQVSPKRIKYFLTPEGFKEKSHMVRDYLSRSLAFFRDARTQCEEILNECKAQGLEKVALIGAGDLADIAKLVAQGIGILVYEVDIHADLKEYQAVLITDIINPQGSYIFLINKLEGCKLLTLPLLHISRIVI